MLKGILLGIIFGVIVLTGIAIAYNQFHIETSPKANILNILTNKQIQKLQDGEKISSLELKQQQVEEIIETLEHMDAYDVELTEAEKILLDNIMKNKVKEVTKEDVNLLKKEIADGLLKMGLNLKPEMIESLKDN